MRNDYFINFNYQLTAPVSVIHPEKRPAAARISFLKHLVNGGRLLQYKISGAERSPAANLNFINESVRFAKITIPNCFGIVKNFLAESVQRIGIRFNLYAPRCALNANFKD